MLEDFYQQKIEYCLLDVKLHFNNGSDISTSLIQRKCRVGYNTAYLTLQLLIEEGFVKSGGFGTSKVIKDL